MGSSLAITLNPMGNGLATGIVEDNRRNLLIALTKAPIILANCVLLIPAVLRAMGHYVNHSVRGLLPPARWRISPPRFEPSRLRMRIIIRPRVVVPAIQSAPIATHCVATIAHLALAWRGPF